jgi:hypothetical protein
MITYWKPIAIALIVIGIFFAGWHYENLRMDAKELKQTEVDIKQANKKIAEDNKIDADYDRTVTVIENSKPEVPDEKASNCPLPIEWLRSLRAVTH